MNPVPMKYSHSISSPFAVKDREKFLRWARDLGIQVQAVRREPLDRVCISPPPDGEWHFMDVPEDVELSQENGFWAWFAEALGAHLPDNTVVTIFDTHADEDDHDKGAWVGAAVHLISSRGDYAYGDLVDLAHHLLGQQTWPLGQVCLFHAGLQGALDSFVNLPNSQLPTATP
jgi:hypothetical protein